MFSGGDVCDCDIFFHPQNIEFTSKYSNDRLLWVKHPSGLNSITG
jgi:hypothetical protein